MVGSGKTLYNDQSSMATSGKTISGYSGSGMLASTIAANAFTQTVTNLSYSQSSSPPSASATFPTKVTFGAPFSLIDSTGINHQVLTSSTANEASDTIVVNGIQITIAVSTTDGSTFSYTITSTSGPGTLTFVQSTGSNSAYHHVHRYHDASVLAYDPRLISDGSPLIIAQVPCCQCIYGAIFAAIAATVIFGGFAFALATPAIAAFFAADAAVFAGGTLAAAGTNLLGFSSIVSGAVAGYLGTKAAVHHC